MLVLPDHVGGVLVLVVPLGVLGRLGALGHRQDDRGHLLGPPGRGRLDQLRPLLGHGGDGVVGLGAGPLGVVRQVAVGRLGDGGQRAVQDDVDDDVLVGQELGRVIVPGPGIVVRELTVHRGPQGVDLPREFIRDEVIPLDLQLLGFDVPLPGDEVESFLLALITSTCGM